MSDLELDELMAALASTGESLVGQRFGPYEIEAKLGEGGMGAVYRATDTELGRKVALKVLPLDAASDPDRRRRFVREARAAAKVSSPFVAAIYAVSSEDAERPWIAMELIDGKTLRDEIPAAADRARDLARQMAEALAAAHRRGLVHRDFKPDNVMIDASGCVKVLDFGLAKPLATESLESTAGTPLTIKGQVVGTPAYMSPEQAQGLELDARSDVFSFGSVLYELLSGQKPFEGETQVAQLVAIASEQPAKLEGPRDLRRIVERCLQKDPRARYDDGLGVVRALAGAPVRSTKRVALWVACLPLVVALGVAAFGARDVLFGEEQPPGIASWPKLDDPDPWTQFLWRQLMRAEYDGDSGEADVRWQVSAIDHPLVRLLSIRDGLEPAPSNTDALLQEVTNHPAVEDAERWRAIARGILRLNNAQEAAAFTERYPRDLFGRVYTQGRIENLTPSSDGPVDLFPFTREARALDPGVAVTLWQFLVAHWQKYQYEDSRRVFDEARPRLGRLPFFRELDAMTLVAVQRFAEAKVIFSALVSEFPTDASKRRNLLETAIWLGDEETIKRELDALGSGLVRGNSLATQVEGLASQLAARGQVVLEQQAIEIGLRLANTDTERSRLHHIASWSAIGVGDRVRASAAVDAWANLLATATMPDDLRAVARTYLIAAKVRIAAFEGDREEALRHLQTLKSLPEETFVVSGKPSALGWSEAAVSLTTGDAKRAVQQYEEMASVALDVPYARLVHRVGRAQALAQLKRTEEASAVLDLALEDKKGCLALVDDVSVGCRVYVAAAHVLSAEIAETEADRREHLAAFHELWPNADEDHPFVVRAKKLER
jgi:predicted Ser/Thr protein kinase